MAACDVMCAHSSTYVCVRRCEMYVLFAEAAGASLVLIYCREIKFVDSIIRGCSNSESRCGQLVCWVRGLREARRGGARQDSTGQIAQWDAVSMLQLLQLLQLSCLTGLAWMRIWIV